MPWAHNVPVSPPCQALLAIAAASMCSAAVVLTWQQTRNPAIVLGVTFLVLVALQIMYVKYRKAQHCRQAKKYTLPYVRYYEGTDI